MWISVAECKDWFISLVAVFVHVSAFQTPALPLLLAFELKMVLCDDQGNEINQIKLVKYRNNETLWGLWFEMKMIFQANK